jgi:hypothetical protein
MARRPRDSQRQKVYDAERDAFAGGDWEAFCDRSTPLSLEACQAIVDAVFESATLRERYGPTMPIEPPRVVAGHGNRGRGCYKKRPNERVRFKPKRAYTISDAEREKRRERARSLAAARAR